MNEHGRDIHQGVALLGARRALLLLVAAHWVARARARRAAEGRLRDPHDMRGPARMTLVLPARQTSAPQLAPFANRESHVIMLVLKPQDLVVALKIAALSGELWSYPGLASALGMSASGVHESVHRASRAGLVSAERRAVRAALEEFLVHGLKYAFPPERGRATRGMLTAASAPPLVDRLARRDDAPLVWPDPAGTARGESLAPLYPSVPKAASRDPKLYALLAVADALRTGTARERDVAATALRELLAS